MSAGVMAITAGHRDLRRDPLALLHRDPGRAQPQPGPSHFLCCYRNSIFLPRSCQQSLLQTQRDSSLSRDSVTCQHPSSCTVAAES